MNMKTVAIESVFKVPLVLFILNLLLGCTTKFTDEQLALFEKSDHKPTYVKAPTDQLTARFFGTSTLLFDDGEEAILIDGFFSRPRFWQLVFQPLRQKSQVEVKAILDPVLRGKLKAVAVAHAHHDHALDSSCVSLAYDARLVGSSSVLNLYCNGKPATNVFETNNDVTIPNQTEPNDVYVGNNFTLTAIPSKHVVPSKPFPSILGLGKPIKDPLNSQSHLLCYNEGQSYVFLLHHKLTKTNIVVYPSANINESVFRDSINQRVQAKNGTMWLFMGIAGLSSIAPDNIMASIYKTISPTYVVPIHYDDFTREPEGGLQPSIKQIGDFDDDFNALQSATDSHKTQIKLFKYKQAVILSQIRNK
jgi:L-ascorbate metabolism protein UlaG (beta-lactamase superfamily)